MTTEQQAPESEIRVLIERWSTAVRAGDLDGVLADHAEDIREESRYAPTLDHRSAQRTRSVARLARASLLPSSRLTGRVAVAKLIYSAISSLDGYVADEDGKFDWAAPDEEVHSFFNDLERPIGTYFYGRRMYEVMVAWETISLADQQPFIQEFAEMWRAADRIVYSKTLEAVSSSRTRIDRDFDPETVRQMKAAAGSDLSVGGPELAAQAFKAGLVDECHLFVAPIVVGGGKQAFPDGVRAELELLDERRFGSGIVHLRYRTRG